MPMEAPPPLSAMAAASNRRASFPSSMSSLELKSRTVSCLNKLSDRDTFALASAELESMAQSLSPDSFAPFLSCIYHTDSSLKSPVRRQCVRLLSTLALSHANLLSPFLPKMLQSILRRLRESDSAVRFACVDAVSAVAASVTRPPFSSAFLKPFADAILLEQDFNLQIGAALCLAAAIDSAPVVDPAQLQRVLPRFLKLLRSDAFKAKPALASVVGSMVRAGGAHRINLLGVLVPCLVDLLSSDDWAARKAAGEALLRVAEAERELVGEFKDASLLQFEARKFDKVKAVRDTMNRMIQAWKQVPSVSSDDASRPDQSELSSKDNASDDHFPRTSKSSNHTPRSESPSQESKKSSASRSSKALQESASATKAQRSGFSHGFKRSTSPLYRKVDCKKFSELKIEIDVPRNSGSKILHEENIQGGQGRNRNCLEEKGNNQLKHEVKHALFDENGDEKMHKFGGSKAQSRIVPLQEKESTGSTVAASNAVEESYDARKDGDDLSLIRKQLVQIENQQSSLLDLLQKFIGSSQNGMRSLETRVRGLEMALDEISHDFVGSTARITNSDRAEFTCFKLPGAEFLTPKCWRRIDVGRYSNSRFSTSGTPPFLRDKLDKGRFKTPGEFMVNPLADVHLQTSSSEPTGGLNREAGGRQACENNGFQ